MAGHALVLQRAPAEIGADRPGHPAAKPAEAAVSLGRDLQLQLGAVRVAGGVAVLRTTGDPFNRSPGQPAHRGSDQVLRVGVILGAEAPADVLRDDHDLVSFQAETATERVAEDVDAADAGTDPELLLALPPIG